MSWGSVLAKPCVTLNALQNTGLEQRENLQTLIFPHNFDQFSNSEMCVNNNKTDGKLMNEAEG